MPSIFLIIIAASLLAKVTVSQYNYLNYNPYNAANLYGTSSLYNNYGYGLNTLGSTYPYQNNLYTNNNLYSNYNRLYPNTNIYPYTNTYATTNYNQLYQPYNTLGSAYNLPYNGLTSLPTQNNLICEYRLFQGCIAPQTSGCRQCIDSGNALVHNCQCVGGGSFGIGK